MSIRNALLSTYLCDPTAPLIVSRIMFEVFEAELHPSERVFYESSDGGADTYLLLPLPGRARTEWPRVSYQD